MNVVLESFDFLDRLPRHHNVLVLRQACLHLCRRELPLRSIYLLFRHWLLPLTLDVFEGPELWARPLQCGLALSLCQSWLNSCFLAQFVVSLLCNFYFHVHFFSLLYISVLLRFSQSQVVSNIVVLVMFKLQLDHLTVSLLLMVLCLTYDGHSMLVLLCYHFLVCLFNLTCFLLHYLQVKT